MGEWSRDSKSLVATMEHGDFFHTEKSVTIRNNDTLQIQHIDAAGNTIILKDKVAVLSGEIIDASTMVKDALSQFLQE